MSWIVNGTIKKPTYHTKIYMLHGWNIKFSGLCWHPYVQDFKKKKAFPNVHVCMCVFITVDMFNKPVLMPAFCGTDLMVQFDLALCMECWHPSQCQPLSTVTEPHTRRTETEPRITQTLAYPENKDSKIKNNKCFNLKHGKSCTVHISCVYVNEWTDTIIIWNQIHEQILYVVLSDFKSG